MDELNKTLSPAEARQYSPLTLAFLGDSVYERLVRTELVIHANMPANKLHKEAVKLVRAGYQARAAHFLLDGHFTEDEEYIYKRGRNSSHIGAPKSATNTDYRAATGLEAVFGYLELIGSAERIRELYGIIRENIAAEQDQ
ncbi:ribonuclease-3 family protein [Ruminococcus sp. YE71]|uniref:Mini-ribonuclease 3 n=1 Tax=unclassified Ruminococcus TaxID=2608920 RepID=UPI0008868996|nr:MULTISPECIES: ribonuclease III domain-containing protein [unclassified Ruminococcus]SDA29301.1 ribonuclease-3 family protein [Ruminococcus sp. YE78]SFW47965.1 ribonuclease-3 family protein [Ruminococcus sp. YE71]